ncbi:MAG: DJ-1 family glyoxalase III [Clostridia bacterium]|nr:DJ-1 family glyoxalase III [Clostridia bacterium]
MIYVLLVDGFEEIEALEPVDIMRRAGLEVKTVGVYDKMVCGSHNIKVEADITIDEVDVDDMELLMLPGGPGHERLDASNDAHALINAAHSKGIYISAICAAPSILGKKGLFDGKKATCFPGFEKYLYGAEVTSEKVACDGQFITGRGAGAAADFGFKMVELLLSKEKADELRGVMQY